MRFRELTAFAAVLGLLNFGLWILFTWRRGGLSSEFVYDAATALTVAFVIFEVLAFSFLLLRRTVGNRTRKGTRNGGHSNAESDAESGTGPIEPGPKKGTS